jgi:hypothetical protein
MPGATAVSGASGHWIKSTLTLIKGCSEAEKTFRWDLLAGVGCRSADPDEMPYRLHGQQQSEA